MSEDYYKILGVSKDASEDEIKKAYRKLAHKHHPDKKGGDEAKFKEINSAYQVLSNAKKRQQYDQFGSGFDQPGGPGGAGGFSGFSDFGDFAQGSSDGGWEFNFGGSQQGGAGGFEDIFSDVFRSAGFGGRASTQQPVGSDIAVDIDVTFEEMAKGVEKEIQLYKKVKCSHCDGTGAEDKKMKTCSQCKGTGKITKTVRTIFGNIQQQVVCDKCHGAGKIPEKKCKHCGGDGVTKENQTVKIKVPAGIENGQTIKVVGQGESIQGGSAGDLYTTVHVSSEDGLTREGNNIVSEEKLSFTQAALGTVIKIKTVHGDTKVKIPAGTQPEDILRVKGRGIHREGYFNKGDHLIKIKVEVPNKLNSEQLKVVEKLKELGL